ncbi:MAG: hypothetical protein B6I37_09075 [Desulfobacteraceae bacterium 4572_35.2]|nr:MAG: hypothetical protein B6I37_09075 [Desulfobacteraceae bacterium 4572_35.2]
MKKLSAIVIPILLLVVIAGGIILLKQRRSAVQDVPLPQRQLHSVRIVTPVQRTISSSSDFLARISAVNSATIASKLNGYITALHVEENQQVKQHQLLVQIDDTDLQTALVASRSRLQAARSRLTYLDSICKRNRQLFEAGGLAREQLDAAIANRTDAQATLSEITTTIERLTKQLEYCSIRAPFAGTIGSIFLRSGALATTGKPILKLNSPQQKLTFSFMPQGVKIIPRQAVLLKEKPIASISRLYADAQQGLQVAEAILAQKLDLPVDSYINVAVVTGTAQGCAVPLQALVQHPPEQEQNISQATTSSSVMVLRQGVFVATAVQVVLRDRHFALIEPPITAPVAVASQAKLSQLPGFGMAIMTVAGQKDTAGNGLKNE